MLALFFGRLSSWLLSANVRLAKRGLPAAARSYADEWFASWEYELRDELKAKGASGASAELFVLARVATLPLFLRTIRRQAVKGAASDLVKSLVANPRADHQSDGPSAHAATTYRDIAPPLRLSEVVFRSTAYSTVLGDKAARKAFEISWDERELEEETSGKSSPPAYLSEALSRSMLYVGIVGYKAAFKAFGLSEDGWQLEEETSAK